ncbi:MAG: endonuclease III [Oscillospiraceae bacterium]|nr:endonuclease III [Oscillospiraceae bacterium]
MQKLIERLKNLYPSPECTLVYDRDWKLLFGARLAAQCTDERVNKVSVFLYERFPYLESIASADIAEIEEIVRPCGFYRQKARDLVFGAVKLLKNFDGKVPDTMEDLLSIPGVGRKTANLMLGELFGKPAVVADTHCIRLSNRLGLCKTKDPVKVENILRKKIPPNEQLLFCHRLVQHGREVCHARNPVCGKCSLADICPSYRPI